MKQFEDAVAVAIRGMSESGKIQEIIEKQVAATVEGVIKDALGRYKPFGQDLAKALEGALRVNVEDIGLTGYNHIVLEIVRRKLEDAIQTVGAKNLEADLDRLLSTAAPKEIKLSTLVKNFKRWVREKRTTDHDHNVTAILERSQYGTMYIYLDTKGNTEKYACEFRLAVHGDTGEMWSARFGGNEIGNTLFLGGLFGFERDIFNMHTAKTKLIIDTECPDTFLEGDGDDDDED